MPFVRKTSSPPGRKRRAALGIQRYGISPDGCPVLAGGEVEACIGQTGRLGIAVDEREVVVVLVLERARRAELLGELSMPVGRPPRCARQATSNLVFDFGENRVRIDVLKIRKDRAGRRNRHDLWIFGGVCSALLRP